MTARAVAEPVSAGVTVRLRFPSIIPLCYSSQPSMITSSPPHLLSTPTHLIINTSPLAILQPPHSSAALNQTGAEHNGQHRCSNGIQGSGKQWNESSNCLLGHKCAGLASGVSCGGWLQRVGCAAAVACAAAKQHMWVCRHTTKTDMYTSNATRGVQQLHQQPTSTTPAQLPLYNPSNPTPVCAASDVWPAKQRGGVVCNNGLRPGARLQLAGHGRAVSSIDGGRG